jgi:hypothetical protein
MPYANGVSAKSHDFDAQGNETHTDYKKMLDIVIASNYARCFEIFLYFSILHLV